MLEGWGGAVYLKVETLRDSDSGGRMRGPMKSWVLLWQMFHRNGGNYGSDWGCKDGD